jgi:hypothetical protein
MAKVKKKKTSAAVRKLFDWGVAHHERTIKECRMRIQ